MHAGKGHEFEMHINTCLPEIFYGEIPVLQISDRLLKGSRIGAWVEYHPADVPVISHPVLCGLEVAAHHTQQFVHGIEGYDDVKPHRGVFGDVFEYTAYFYGDVLPVFQENYLSDCFVKSSELLGEGTGDHGSVPVAEHFCRVSCQYGTRKYLEMIGVGEYYVLRSIFVLFPVEYVAGTVAYEGGAGRVFYLRYFLPHIVGYCTGSLAVGTAALIGLGEFLLYAVDIPVVGVELVIAVFEGDLGYEYKPYCQSDGHGQYLEYAYVELSHGDFRMEIEGIISCPGG